MTCALEVVLCKANPGLVPFQAGRVKVALPVELLKKKKLSCLENNTPETPRDVGILWTALEFSVVHSLGFSTKPGEQLALP